MSDDPLAPLAVGDPAVTGRPRPGPITALLVADDPRPAEAVLAARSDPARPHYYLSQYGILYRLVADERVAPGQPDDALVVWLERPVGGAYSPAQEQGLARVQAALRGRYGLDEPGLGGASGGAPEPEPPSADLLDLLIEAAPPAAALGDGRVSEALWSFLYGEMWRVRGGALNLGQAFALHAAHTGLGAPVGANQQLTQNGQRYNYQALARDLIYNLDARYREVQSLSALLPADGSPPATGTVARALLDASYAAARNPATPQAPAFQANKRFHLEALRARLGPPLGRDGYSADRAYIAQVFAGDTLYAPASSQAEARFLSRTPTTDPAYRAVWAEVYRRIGATYNPEATLHRVAMQDRLGMPLTGPYSAVFEGTRYNIQVFAYDTVFAGPDGVPRRFSRLEPPEAVRGWRPADPADGRRRWVLQPPRPGDPAWPPKPAFGFIPTAGGVRDQLFGRLEWRRVAYGRREVLITNGWAARNIVHVAIPQLAAIPGGGGGRARFHRLAADQLRRLWQAWEDYGLLRLVLRYDGDFVARTISADPRAPGYNVLSNHAYGVAFDINARWNGYGVQAALVGQEGSVRELVELAHLHGFYWGGHWPRAIEDGMHFEWAREA